MMLPWSDEEMSHFRGAIPAEALLPSVTPRYLDECGRDGPPMSVLMRRLQHQRIVALALDLCGTSPAKSERSA